MTAGELFKEELLVNQFGESRVWETARRFREVWPDGLPQGREKITTRHAAYFLYVLSSTQGPKDVPVSILRSSQYHNANDNVPVVELSNILFREGKGVERVEISTRTGFMDVHSHAGKAVLFPDERTRSKEESGNLILWRRKQQELQVEIQNGSEGYAKEVLEKELEAMTKRITIAETANKNYSEKFGLANADQVDFKTVLKNPFLEALGKKLK